MVHKGRHSPERIEPRGDKDDYPGRSDRTFGGTGYPTSRLVTRCPPSAPLVSGWRCIRASGYPRRQIRYCTKGSEFCTRPLTVRSASALSWDATRRWEANMPSLANTAVQVGVLFALCSGHPIVLAGSGGGQQIPLAQARDLQVEEEPRVRQLGQCMLDRTS